MGFNAPAEAIFDFDKHTPERRNLLWLLFTDAAMYECLDAWEEQAQHMLSSFRRGFAKASQETDIHELVNDLERVSPEFKAWWLQHHVHALCHHEHKLVVDGQIVAFEHTSLTIDEDRHLQLAVYIRQQEEAIACE